MTGVDSVTAPRGVLPRRRKIGFAIVAFLSVTIGLFAALLVLDIYLHHRVPYGVNVWGYRGSVVGRKQQGETRVAAIGGSTVFGFGLPWREAWPYYLERQLNALRTGRVPVTVVNLGVPTDSARTFVATMEDFAYLKCDVVILYEGYNDLELDVGAPQKGNAANPASVPHYLAWRHQSPIFRWTGYFPIFPLVLNEKAALLLHGGERAAAHSSRDIVFKPGLAARATAGVMKATAEIGVALEERFGRLTANGPSVTAAYEAGCGRWSQYCGAVEGAVRYALERGQRILVVTQPYLSDLHVDQQRALAASLERQFEGDSRVRYLNLGRVVDLGDRQMAYDRLHLTASGNERIAATLAPVLLEMIR